MTVMVHLGFTGTREGCTGEQVEALRAFFSAFTIDVTLHHGDCEGADLDAFLIADSLGWTTVAHPGVDKSGESPHRVFTPSTVIREPLPYMRRNYNIIMESRALIACPSGPEKLRSGTWSTIRRAIKLNETVTVFWPSGSYTRMYSAAAYGPTAY